MSRVCTSQRPVGETCTLRLRSCRHPIESITFCETTACRSAVRRMALQRFGKKCCAVIRGVFRCHCNVLFEGTYMVGPDVYSRRPMVVFWEESV